MRQRRCRWYHKRLVIAWLVFSFAGLAILLYRGVGWVFLRYYAGDVVGMAFLYFTLSLFWETPAAICVCQGVSCSLRLAAPNVPPRSPHLSILPRL
ncbi:hypothetical protein [Microcoleus sp. FACHB-672]|uniref:hypothetical protein n=1 Tax=Microcoleus sp. FACHB-672 TaxID=2692825 RepID=UPI0019A50581|nr:hypothetical protein [Microcoleus sp. FACHB-672]MBD2039845.1 hypothetical protein [Microcoleus sp. FACHB-672]